MCCFQPSRDKSQQNTKGERGLLRASYRQAAVIPGLGTHPSLRESPLAREHEHGRKQLGWRWLSNQGSGWAPVQGALDALPRDPSPASRSSRRPMIFAGNCERLAAMRREGAIRN